MTTRVTLPDALGREVLARLALLREPQSALAAATGIPESTLSRRIAGRGSTFTVDELRRVAAYLDTTAHALLAAAEARVDEDAA